MPELPEVETVVRTLRDSVLGEKIVGATVETSGLKLLGGLSEDEFRENVISKKIETIERRGKFILISLSRTEQNLVVHLRMTGKFSYRDQPSPAWLMSEENNPEDGSDRYLRLSLILEKGVLKFLDKRRFATFHLVKPDDYRGLQSLGPDALSASFNLEYLSDKLENRTRPIYSTLLDQQIVAGFGNIYVCETLYAAGVHPLTPSNSLKSEKLSAIIQHGQRILREAIELNGTSFSDYSDTLGNFGKFQEFLKVYGKRPPNHPHVKRLKISGRTVYYVD